MRDPYALAASVRDRQNMLLADAEGARWARQAPARHHQRGTPATRRSPLRWTPAWLASARSRLLTRRAESAAVAARGVCGP
jgi:hypothetical protein